MDVPGIEIQTLPGLSTIIVATLSLGSPCFLSRCSNFEYEESMMSKTTTSCDQQRSLVGNNILKIIISKAGRSIQKPGISTGWLGDLNAMNKTTQPDPVLFILG